MAFSKGNPVEFTDDWHYTVLEDHAVWSELGLPFDLRELPRPMVQAHLALIRGKNERREQERADHERDLRRAQR